MPAALADNASVTTGFVQPASSATRKKVGRSVVRHIENFSIHLQIGPDEHREMSSRCRYYSLDTSLRVVHPSVREIYSFNFCFYFFFLSFAETTRTHTHTQASAVASSKRLLSRGNDILTQSSTETLLEMLKSHANIKECSEETALHINGVNVQLDCYVDIL